MATTRVPFAHSFAFTFYFCLPCVFHKKVLAPLLFLSFSQEGNNAAGDFVLNAQVVIQVCSEDSTWCNKIKK